jgi:predicted cupin superfamily sugar epimerase
VKIHPRAASLIRRLKLQPHPEGGFYREVYRSAEGVPTARGRRAAVTGIYFLLVRGQRSVFHRVRSDEIWHWYEGAPLRLIDVNAKLAKCVEYRLGPERGATRQVVTIPANHWQAAQSRGDYTLVGCTVAPGFDFSDFSLLRDEPRTHPQLIQKFPKLARFAG